MSEPGQDSLKLNPDHATPPHGKETPRARPASPLANRTWLILGVVIAAIVSLVIPYRKLCARVDQRLAVGLFRGAVRYFAAPESWSVGDRASADELIASSNRVGVQTVLRGSTLHIQFAVPVEVRLAKGCITAITLAGTQRSLAHFEFPPQLVTNISDGDRSKRTLVRFSELPPVLIQAIVSAEDKRFFSHSGFDLPRVTKAVYVDLKEHRKKQGASTISMQLARNVWLSRNKSWRRKIEEALVTLHLERKLTKQEIFEDYCNTVYLGDRGSFRVNGAGEAARTYFGKDVKQLTVPEAATLAGLIQRPSYLNPFRYPDRALARRNIVLRLMRKNGYIDRTSYEVAVQSPLGLHPGTDASGQSQYFLDIASDTLRKQREFPSNGTASVNTTIDLRLQRAAESAVQEGLDYVNKQLVASKRSRTDAVRPQAVLIALDPHTGEVKALAGGVDYSASQFNRVIAKRPPGSAFKPFVYAAALSTSLRNGAHEYTEASTVDDSPATIEYGRGQTYTPNNFKAQYQGTVTFRQALAHSLNVAAVKVGEMAGLENVVTLAHSAGLNDDIRPTPAVALGAYQVTPLEIAEAYTIFANGGVRVRPLFVVSMEDADGTVRYQPRAEERVVLDPRVAFLMVDMLQEVMRSGTAAGVRSRGFQLPAAGKTGTSHDGWFAGFTSKLLCVVWVGFDDYRELGLEGARSALPIWTEFMKAAANYAQYRNTKPFEPPPGLVKADVDLDSGHLGTSDCPGKVVPFYFIEGTQPTEICGPLQVEISPAEGGGVLERLVKGPAR